MSTDTPAAVFDAMVFLQAMANDQGPAFACQRLVDEGKLTLFVSPAVLEEAKEIANRPLLQRKFKNLTPKHVETFLQDVRAVAILIADVPHVFSYSRDPDDEPYINLAIAAGAQYLVSRDNDLLDLMQDQAFRKRFAGLTILNPVALLREFSPKPGESPAPEEPSS
jgi:putative PIN family toxin of toxin-antitoxin system